MMMHRNKLLLGTLAVLAWALAAPAARADFFFTDAQFGLVQDVTPSGSVSTFASGFDVPGFLAFDSPIAACSSSRPSSSSSRSRSPRAWSWPWSVRSVWPAMAGGGETWPPSERREGFPFGRASVHRDAGD